MFSERFGRKGGGEGVRWLREGEVGRVVSSGFSMLAGGMFGPEKGDGWVGGGA